MAPPPEGTSRVEPLPCPPQSRVRGSRYSASGRGKSRSVGPLVRPSGRDSACADRLRSAQSDNLLLDVVPVQHREPVPGLALDRGARHRAPRTRSRVSIELALPPFSSEDGRVLYSPHWIAEM